MEFRHLRYFVTVAEEGNFTRAARRLYIAQPALSKQIHDLEAEIGTRLLVRSARGASPTGAGLELLELARTILGAEAAAGERIRSLAATLHAERTPVAAPRRRVAGAVLPLRAAQRARGPVTAEPSRAVA